MHIYIIYDNPSYVKQKTTNCSKIIKEGYNKKEKAENRVDIEKIGVRRRELRREMAITQNMLADVLGVTQDSISLWENCKRVPDTQYVVLLCKFFNVTADYILGITEDCKPLSMK